MHINDITPMPLYAPAENVEGFTQEVWARWLLNYFTGQPFQYYHGVTIMQKTLPHCDVGFAEFAIPDPFVRPLIHCYLLSAVDTLLCKVKGVSTYHSSHRMTIDVMVPSSLSRLEGMPGNRAEHHCRAVADELYWLLQTQERGALVVAGIRKVRALRRPVVNSAPTGFYKRNFLVGYDFTYTVQ